MPVRWTHTRLPPLVLLAVVVAVFLAHHATASRDGGGDGAPPLPVGGGRKRPPPPLGGGRKRPVPPRMPVPAAPVADVNSSTSTSDSGLSTAALVGICVGAGVGVLVIVAVVYMIISYRRERTIDRAASMRIKSRRVERQIPADEESKWRQMYSARMAESMRRTEEATARGNAANRGPSFVEAQDRVYAEQAGAADRQLTPAMSSKGSFGRGIPQAELSSTAKLERESPDHSLMMGSELSSPQPSVSSSGRKKSFRKLFGK